MNKVNLIGNLTKDPESRTVPSSGKTVANFTLAVTRRFKNASGEREVDFIPIVVWGAQAESCVKYLRKGSKCGVCGSIQTRTYEAQDKTRRYVTEVVAEEVEFLDSKQKSDAPKPQNNSDECPGVEMQEVSGDTMPF